MSKASSAAVLTAGGIASAVIMVVGINISSEGVGNAHRDPRDPVVTSPITPPQATVAPEVAKEMNGKRGNVKMAGGIKMHAPQKGLGGLAGKGQGNGCLKAYGEPGQCLPVLSPAQQAMPDMDHPWTCADVRQLFPSGIVVHGKDTLGLDSDRDGVACGLGDG